MFPFYSLNDLNGKMFFFPEGGLHFWGGGWDNKLPLKNVSSPKRAILQPCNPREVGVIPNDLRHAGNTAVSLLFWKGATDLRLQVMLVD